MVYIIKDQESATDALNNIAKIMLNIENNKILFPVDESEKTTDFEGQFCHYNFVQNKGMIIIYSDSDISFIEILKKELQCLESNLNISLKKIIQKKCSYINADCINYYLYCKANNVVRIRKFVYYNNANGMKNPDTSFIWYYKIINSKYSEDYYFYKLPFLNKTINNSYLKSAINCIMYDDMNIFHTGKKITKQIDFPYSSQTQLYQRKRLIKDKILLSTKYGINLHLFNKLIEKYNLNISIDKKEYRDVRGDYLWRYSFVCVLDTNLTNIEEISDLFQVKNFSNLKSNFARLLSKPKDHIFKNYKKNKLRCFISNVPIFDDAYVIKLKIENTQHSRSIIISGIFANMEFKYKSKVTKITDFIKKYVKRELKKDITISSIHKIRKINNYVNANAIVKQLDIVPIEKLLIQSILKMIVI